MNTKIKSDILARQAHLPQRQWQRMIRRTDLDRDANLTCACFLWEMRNRQLAQAQGRREIEHYRRVLVDFSPDDLQQGVAKGLWPSVSKALAGSVLARWRMDGTVIYVPMCKPFVCNPWWKDYPCALLVEQFEPWSFFLSLGSLHFGNGGEMMECNGAYVGFECRQGQLRLYCQAVLEEVVDPLFYFELPLEVETLGQAWEAFDYDLPFFEALHADFAESFSAARFRAHVGRVGRTVWHAVLPVLAGVLSGELTFETALWDADECTLQRKPLKVMKRDPAPRWKVFESAYADSEVKIYAGLAQTEERTIN